MRWVSVMEIVRPVGTCGKSITMDWTQPVRRQGKASEIVVIGPVGDIARTDGTEWAGSVNGTID